MTAAVNGDDETESFLEGSSSSWECDSESDSSSDDSNSEYETSPMEAND